jgi:midasin (ATPase involved in ribosome maturation)
MEYLMNRNSKKFVDAASAKFGNGAVMTRDQIQELCDEQNIPFPYWFVSRTQYRADRGKYRLPSENNQSEVVPAPVLADETVALAPMTNQPTTYIRQKKLIEDSDVAIPAKYENYVPFGFFNDMKKIVKSNQFYPVFVSGHSGNGKTLMIEQVCAELQRECIRINISVETDESDLLGGPTLVDGNVVVKDGPVIVAMKRGAILLIDEIDRGSNKLMCIQGIMEGKPYFNKKNGEVVVPAEGFNIIATANTKGQGSDEGKYLAQILDSAFLERFVITVEQEYPPAAVERKILEPLIADKDFAEKLVLWADAIRKTYADGAIDEIISTRRLVHIAKTYAIFNDKMKAIDLCVSRFDTDTKLAFLDLYTKIDESANQPTANTAPADHADTEVPF